MALELRAHIGRRSEFIMWIQLTGGDGEKIAFEAKHLVSLKDHGDYTLLVHTHGEVLVRESRTAILNALQLPPTERMEFSGEQSFGLN
ncbi:MULTISPECIES: hypothetical protein [unclassified Mesorhizobium]|uniref:hypothetical protein n=1 Tax=unclassified Mesorhizobium TaxID=325217 RepID=UPI003014D12F